MYVVLIQTKESLKSGKKVFRLNLVMLPKILSHGFMSLSAKGIGHWLLCVEKIKVDLNFVIVKFGTHFLSVVIKNLSTFLGYTATT